MSLYFPFAGETLHCLDAGQGPALLFLHGLGGNALNWAHQQRHFAGTHRVLSLDLPGHGKSQGRQMPFERYWEAAEALLDHLDLPSASVCGLSKGARAGMALAARRPERVDALVVVNAFVHLDDEDKRKRVALYELLAGGREGAEAWARRLLENMGVAQHAAIVRGFLKSLDQIDPAHIRRVFMQLIQLDQRAEVATVTCPTLLVRGERDGFIPPYCLDELHALIAGSVVERLADCGHLPYLEDPARFNAAVERFLSTSF